ncbi:MAG: type II secretion system protein [Verrucomicrobiales bacterium]|nr:type II secretion system protein [Verrucomicrobiales bacterium]
MAAHPERKGGFTLLEMMLAVAVFLILITSAFSLVGATTELMTEVSEAQKESALQLRFLESCRTAFEATNLNSSIEFHHFDRGGNTFDTYLSFVNTPAAFDFGMNSREEIERTVLAAEIRPDGFIRSRIYYLTRESFEAAERTDFSEIEGPHLELIPRQRQLSWLFYNENTQRWEPTLEGNFPNSMVKLILQVDGTTEPIETVFYYLKGGS